MIPLGIVLIPALLITLAILFFGILTTWAIFRYGGDFGAFLGTVCYWGATIFVIGIAWSYLSPVDWFGPLFGTASVFGPPTF